MSFIESKKKRPGSFRHIWPNLGRYRIWTLAAAIFGGLEVMLEVLIPMLMSVIVDGGLYREQDFMLRELFPETLIANRDRFVLTVGIIMVIVACCSMACGILSARCSAVASQGFAKNLRANLLGKIQDFSFANTDHFTTSSLITRATTDVNTVRNTMQQFLRTLIRSPFMVLMATVMAFTISPHLAVIFLISIPFLAGVLAILMKIGQPRFRKMLQKMDSMNRAVQENLISSRVVKAYVRGDYESERFRGTAEDLRQATLSSSRLFTLTGPIQMSILWGCTIVLLLLGGREIIFRTTGLLTGELVSLVSYTTQAVNALTMLTWLIMALSRAHASLVRINEVLDETVDITDGPSDAVVEDGSVDFEDVCFSYSGDPDKLARVFDNILRNAIAYCYENTKIEIQARMKNNKIEITFTNSGDRIPGDMLQTIFEKFYRVDNSRSTGTGGAGLGLAIAKEIVELHDGQIMAKSDDLHTQFIVTLPSENELEENEEGSKNEIHTHRRHTFGGRPVHWKLPKGKAGKGDMDQS